MLRVRIVRGTAAVPADAFGGRSEKAILHVFLPPVSLFVDAHLHTASTSLHSLTAVKLPPPVEPPTPLKLNLLRGSNVSAGIPKH